MAVECWIDCHMVLIGFLFPVLTLVSICAVCLINLLEINSQ